MPLDANEKQPRGVGENLDRQRMKARLSSFFAKYIGNTSGVMKETTQIAATMAVNEVKGLVLRLTIPTTDRPARNE